MGEGVNEYPIQPGKVQPPTLRDQTLARDRLLDWLAAKIHQRVVLVIADAGYGKTTLLADFTERTRCACSGIGSTTKTVIGSRSCVI